MHAATLQRFQSPVTALQPRPEGWQAAIEREASANPAVAVAVALASAPTASAAITGAGGCRGCGETLRSIGTDINANGVAVLLELAQRKTSWCRPCAAPMARPASSLPWCARCQLHRRARCLTLPQLARPIGRHVKTKMLPVPNGGRAIPDVRLSDHSPLWDAGYDAVMVTDTSFLRNPHYHRAVSDTIDTLDLPFLAVTEGLDAWLPLSRL
jgi:hypothetical protein